MKNMIRVATISPDVHIGNVEANILEICSLIDKVYDADFIVTPELSLTGYTIQDMIMNRDILDKFSENNLLTTLSPIMEALGYRRVIAVGAPIEVNGAIYNCAIIVNNNGVIGIIPKTYIPNYSEFYEKRWFTGANERNTPSNLRLYKGYKGGNVAGSSDYSYVAFGNELLFKFNDVSIGVELCEDLWSVIPPSSNMALNGADIIINLSASNETIGKAKYRRELVAQQSARCICGYVYCSAGSSESTSDIVFGGHNIIAENGKILAESKLFDKENGIIKADIDLDVIRHDRAVNKTFGSSNSVCNNKVVTVNRYMQNNAESIREVSITPFVPKNISERCKEIFDIQVEGLARRWERTGSKCVVIGVSGGLDSTLALLVAIGAADRLGYEHNRVLGITMPCFGTSSRTKKNAVELMKALDCSMREVNIGESVKQHLKDIGLSEDDRSVAYENAQARERTQVLMDIANMEGGFVIGTGDLSELALGWCTYNGDHMSMYSVNSSIPKTLVRAMVENAEAYKLGGYVLNGAMTTAIKDILDTPISPELLPPDKDGNVAQLTENSVGPYVLNDFFLYYTLRYGSGAKKVLELAKLAVEQSDVYKYSTNEIKHWLKKFYNRFARAQFKRNCCPDGVKVGSVSFSPRGDWRMPSEFDISAWINELE